MVIELYNYKGHAIINNEHEVYFDSTNCYHTLCICPYCDEGYIAPYWKYCPLCGTKVEIKGID